LTGSNNKSDATIMMETKTYSVYLSSFMRKTLLWKISSTKSPVKLKSWKIKLKTKRKRFKRCTWKEQPTI